MKKMFAAALAVILLSAFTASAGSYTYKKGYRGNFGIGAGNVAGENIFRLISKVPCEAIRRLCIA